MLGEGPARLPPAACLPGLSAHLWRERPVSRPLVPLWQVKEQGQAQLLVGQTFWDRFASDSLLTGCAAFAAEKWGP